MAYDYTIVLASAGSLLGIIGYILYYRSIFQGVTKPHLFTWLAYAIIDALAFFAQWVEGGGPGAWVTFVGVIGNTGVALIALRAGEKNITRGDWVSLIGAFGGILVWKLTSVPLTAVVVATVTNTIALFPTFRKSYFKPNEESVSIWILDLGRFSLGIASLASFSLTTVLFPLGVLFANGSLVSMIVFRRWQLRTK